MNTLHLSKFSRLLTAATLDELIDALRQQGAEEDVLSFARSQKDGKTQGRLLSELKKNPQLTVAELEEFAKPEEEKNTPQEIAFVKQHCSQEMQDWSLVQLRKLRNMSTLNPEAAANGEIPYDLFMEVISGELKDWVEHARPKPQLINFDWKQAMDASDEWHTAMAAGGAGKTYIETGPGSIVYGPQWRDSKFNGWTLRKVTSLNDMQVEGNILSHCVGTHGYAQKVKEGRCQIFSLRDPSENPVLTIETSGDGSSFIQIKGKGNRLPNIEERKALVEAFGIQPPQVVRDTWPDPFMNGWKLLKNTDSRYLALLDSSGRHELDGQILTDPSGSIWASIIMDCFSPTGLEEFSWRKTATPELIQALRAAYNIKPPVEVFKQPLEQMDRYGIPNKNGGWSIHKIVDNREWSLNSELPDTEEDESVVYQIMSPDGKTQGSIEVDSKTGGVIKISEDPRAYQISWNRAVTCPAGYDAAIADWVKSRKDAPKAWERDPRDERGETTLSDLQDDLNIIIDGNLDKFGLKLPASGSVVDKLDDAEMVIQKESTDRNGMMSGNDIPELIVDAAAAQGNLDLAKLQQTLWDKNDEWYDAFSDNYYSNPDSFDEEEPNPDDFEDDKKYDEAQAQWESDREKHIEEDRDYAADESQKYMPWALYNQALERLIELQKAKKVPDNGKLSAILNEWHEQNLKQWIKDNIKLKKDIQTYLKRLSQRTPNPKQPKFPSTWNHTWDVRNDIGGRRALSEALVKLGLKNRVPIPLDLKYYRDKLTKPQPRLSNK